MFSRFDRHDLLVVGHGPAREMLERMVAELGLSSWVRFVGWRSDVPSILAASDALILPSQWEGMPNVVLEAMAAGKPLVACQVEGVLEILGPLADPQTVPVGDAAAFVAKLAQIVEDPAHAEQLGAANRQRVEQHFSIERMAQQYDLLYTSLVAAASVNPPRAE
jgi:glycosyltransferase involved in cell wall biosynthesis